MNSAVIVTGVCGGIGAAISRCLQGADYWVIGIDRHNSGAAKVDNVDYYIETDLATLDLPTRLQQLHDQLSLARHDRPLKALVNNAAIQLPASLQVLSEVDFNLSMAVNVTAPMILTKLLAVELAAAAGSVVNIGSIHSQLTKPGFIAYATSKAALEGLTRALAVDCGHLFRVNLIKPAAVDTAMLRAGFEGQPEQFRQLNDLHPSRRIGRPEDIANGVRFLIADDCPLANGAILNLDGGIGCRLHDPV